MKYFLALTILTASFVFCGDAKKNIVMEGDHIMIHYTGTLENGEVFEKTEKGKPMDLLLGAGEMPEAFEKALIGMKLGVGKILRFKAEEMFGLWKKELVKTFDKASFPAEFKPKVGQTVGFPQDGDKPVPGIIKAITDTSITIDFNHKLAGKNLTFNVRVVAIDLENRKK